MDNIKNNIEYIAYLIKKAKSEAEPKPIIFLGAGASASAGIPLTKVIVRHIKFKYKHNPVIKMMIAKEVDDYYTIMQALTTDERKELFYYYITRKRVKINVTSIYLAQLLKEGYIDYILTVNFDDLILRACGLFNFSPPVYDISNVKLPTTSNYMTKSVIYMHGQHFGQWLLNNEEELEKVREDVVNVLNEIKTKRTWIVVGYSGQDEIFNHIRNLGCFSNELFWINYLNHIPPENVSKELIEKSNTNAYLVKGYNSDSFFLKLNSELGLDTPDIFNKPFSFLKEIVANVKDVIAYKQTKEHEELYESVKERMDITNKWIERAIDEIQEEDSIEKFKQEIIDAYTKGEFSENEKVFSKKIVKENFKNAKKELSDFFLSWGTDLLRLARKKDDKKLFYDSFKKYEKAAEFMPSKASIYNNWGSAILGLARKENNEKLYKMSVNKYKKAASIDPNLYSIYNNWGNALTGLAKKTNNDQLFLESFEKYNRSIELKKENYLAIDNKVGSQLYYIQSSRQLSQKEINSILYEAKKVSFLVYKNGGNPYNLSCVLSRLKEKESALKYLKDALDKKTVSKEYVIGDVDWKEYLEDKSFLELLDNYK